MSPATPTSRAPENEEIRIDGGEWEPCAFSLEGQDVDIVREGDPSPTRFALSWLREIRVYRGPDGSVTEVGLRARDGRILAARPRTSLIDTMLALGWEAGVTITSTTSDAIPTA